MKDMFYSKKPQISIDSVKERLRSNNNARQKEIKEKLTSLPSGQRSSCHLSSTDS
jgi:hypothetical protein